MKVTPVINFTGQCDEAIRFYEHAFETKADVVLRYSDAKPEDWQDALTDDEQDYVYHAEMHIGDQRVMLSDIIEYDIIYGNSSFLVITFDTKGEVETVFSRMATDAVILSPMKSTTYSSCFVNFIDKFGIRWVLMTEQTEM